MEVYADVLVVVNYVINLLVLMAAAKLAGVVTRRGRLGLGALTGALGALVIFLPYIGWWFQAGYKLLLSCVMVLAAFGWQNRRRFLKLLLAVAVSAVGMGGLLFLLSFLAEPVGMFFYNGVVYFDLPMLLLVGCCTGAYLVLWLVDRLFFSRSAPKHLYDLVITSEGKQISLKGLADTGSNLKEPFSGAPVIVCDRGLAERIRPQEQTRFRIIPCVTGFGKCRRRTGMSCVTVTGDGALEAFRPDEIRISGEGAQIQTSDVYIAVSRQPIGGEYQAVMNPCLVGESLSRSI